MKRFKANWRPGSSADVEARRVMPRFADAYLRAGGKAARKGADESKLHEFRLVTKDFRYLLESFQPFYGTKAKPYFEKLRRIQKILGELNDYAVTRQRMADERGADRDLLLAYLYKRQKRALRRFLRYWQTHFDSGEQKSKWVDGLR